MDNQAIPTRSSSGTLLHGFGNHVLEIPRSFLSSVHLCCKTVYHLFSLPSLASTFYHFQSSRSDKLFQTSPCQYVSNEGILLFLILYTIDQRRCLSRFYHYFYHLSHMHLPCHKKANWNIFSQLTNTVR